MDKQPIPKTMLEAVRAFADPQKAHDLFVQLRWPNGVACPRACGSVNVAYMPKQRRWYCNDCKGQFTAKVGTIFEDSPIGFDKWLPAFWLLASNRNGISSYELARALKTTQRTAWFMLHRIRAAMADESFDPFRGPVEADETFVGGKLAFMHRKRANRFRRATPWNPSQSVRTNPVANKTVVLGMIERKGKVRAFVVPSSKKGTLQHGVRKWVLPGATVYTDALKSYQGLAPDYVHHVINHAIEYVRGHAHTNSIESFWSVFKRTLKGTYIAPRPQHLQRYVDEQVFRFNERENADGPRFVKAAARADGKHLTWKALTSRD